MTALEEVKQELGEMIAKADEAEFGLFDLEISAWESLKEVRDMIEDVERRHQ